VAQSPLASQSPPASSLTPPALDVVSYQLPLEGPYQFVLNGLPGLWTYVLVRAWIPVDPNNPDPDAQALIEEYNLRSWSWVPPRPPSGRSSHLRDRWNSPCRRIRPS